MHDDTFRHHVSSYRFAFAWVTFVTATPAWGADLIDIKQIVATIDANLSKIESLDVRCEFEHEFGPDRKIDVCFWGWFNSRIRVKHEKRRIGFVNPGMGKRSRNGALFNEDVFWDGDRHFSYQLNPSAFFFGSEESSSEYYSPYFWCVGDAFFSENSRSAFKRLSDNPLVDPKGAIRNILRTGGWTTDQIGSRIHLRNGKSKIVLDADMGFALRERFVPSDKPNGADTHIRNTAFKEVVPGVWLPTAAVIRRFSQEGRAGGVLKMKVTELTINSVTDDAFELVPPEGTLMYNRDTKEQWRYTKPGEDPFDKSIHDAASLLNATVDGNQTALISANIAAFMSLVTIIVSKRRRQGKGAEVSRGQAEMNDNNG